jgi:hypothetical protein
LSEEKDLKGMQEKDRLFPRETAISAEASIIEDNKSHDRPASPEIH